MSQRPIVCKAERVIDADPSRVWALVADPEKLARWAGVSTVGYMGTELPKPGQRIFVRARHGFLPGRQRRVEIKSWTAGSAVSCDVGARPVPIKFDLEIEPEVGPERITTRVRLRHRSEVPARLDQIAAWWVTSRLQRMLDRIERAVAG